MEGTSATLPGENGTKGGYGMEGKEGTKGTQSGENERVNYISWEVSGGTNSMEDKFIIGSELKIIQNL